MKKHFVNTVMGNRKKRGLLLLAITCLLTLMSGMLAGCSFEEVILTLPVTDTDTAPIEEEEEIVESISMDSLEVEGIMNTFMTAYFAGDADIIEQYLSESSAQEVELYGDLEHADEVQINGIRGSRYDIVGNIGDECELSVEFANPGEDFFTYLTVVFVKEESGWKINSYGLEK